jgi:Ca-activated chloride channel family protein
MNLSFAHPWLLLLLAVPAGLLYWLWRGPTRGVALPVDHVEQRPGLAWKLLLDGAASLPALILAAAILLLAGPLQWSQPQARRVLTNIQFCLDVSGSMTASFGDGSRYDASMEAINGFIDFREGDAFGLTIFGNQVLHWIPLTSDASAFRCAPPFLRPERLPRWFGGTEIGKALLACREELMRREEGDRMIILISDGYSFDLANGNDQTVAKKLREAGIVVYAVHVADGSPPLELETVCQGTGGQVFAAGDEQVLDAVFRRIDEMEPARLERTVPLAMDDFRPVSLACLGLLGLGLLCGFGVRYTPW